MDSFCYLVVFFLPSQLRQCSSLGSMFLILISHLYLLFLTDLGQNKLGMFESINRTYWLGSLSAIWWKSHCNWIFRFYSEVSVKFLHKKIRLSGLGIFTIISKYQKTSLMWMWYYYPKTKIVILGKASYYIKFFSKSVSFFLLLRILEKCDPSDLRPILKL